VERFAENGESSVVEQLGELPTPAGGPEKKRQKKEKDQLGQGNSSATRRPSICRMKSLVIHFGGDKRPTGGARGACGIHATFLGPRTCRCVAQEDSAPGHAGSEIAADRVLQKLCVGFPKDKVNRKRTH